MRVRTNGRTFHRTNEMDKKVMQYCAHLNNESNLPFYHWTHHHSARCFRPPSFYILRGAHSIWLKYGATNGTLCNIICGYACGFLYANLHRNKLLTAFAKCNNNLPNAVEPLVSRQVIDLSCVLFDKFCNCVLQQPHHHANQIYRQNIFGWNAQMKFHYWRWTNEMLTHFVDGAVLLVAT